jgi:hypothetical protein
MWYTIKSTEDWLSRLAGQYLGDVTKWPLIYEQNQDIIGPDPNKITVGQTIWIPVDEQQRPESMTSKSVTPTSIAEKGNKVMIAGGIGMGLIALFILMSKK